MAITRTAILDDDLTGGFGTVFEDAWKQELYNQIDDEFTAKAPAPGTAGRVLTSNGAGVAPSYQTPGGAFSIAATSTLTGAQNNWAPGLSGNTYVPWNGAADAAFTGLAGGVAGQLVTIKNITAAKIATFAHNSGSSSAGNKFKLIATSAPTPIAAGGFITFQYDGTDWQCVAHEQGAWITPTFAAGDFTANGAMTWTLTAGDVTSLRWKLEGRELTVSYSLGTTTVGGTANSELRINNGQWGGFTVAGVQYLLPYTYSDNGGALTTAFHQAGSTLGGSTWIGLYKAAAANWTVPSANNTTVYGTMSFEVA